MVNPLRIHPQFGFSIGYTVYHVYHVYPYLGWCISKGCLHMVWPPGWRHPQSCDAAVPRYSSCAFFAVNLMYQPGLKKQHCTILHFFCLSCPPTGTVPFIFALSQVSLILVSTHCIIPLFFWGVRLSHFHVKSNCCLLLHCLRWKEPKKKVPRWFLCRADWTKGTSLLISVHSELFSPEWEAGKAAFKHVTLSRKGHNSFLGCKPLGPRASLILRWQKKNFTRVGKKSHFDNIARWPLQIR